MHALGSICASKNMEIDVHVAANFDAGILAAGGQCQDRVERDFGPGANADRSFSPVAAHRGPVCQTVLLRLNNMSMLVRKGGVHAQRMS